MKKKIAIVAAVAFVVMLGILLTPPKQCANPTQPASPVDPNKHEPQAVENPLDAIIESVLAWCQEQIDIMDNNSPVSALEQIDRKREERKADFQKRINALDSEQKERYMKDERLIRAFLSVEKRYKECIADALAEEMADWCEEVADIVCSNSPEDALRKIGERKQKEDELRSREKALNEEQHERLKNNEKLKAAISVWQKAQEMLTQPPPEL